MSIYDELGVKRVINAWGTNRSIEMLRVLCTAFDYLFYVLVSTIFDLSNEFSKH